MRGDAEKLFFFSSRRRHTRYIDDWSSDVCSSDLGGVSGSGDRGVLRPVAAPDSRQAAGDLGWGVNSPRGNGQAVPGWRRRRTVASGATAGVRARTQSRRGSLEPAQAGRTQESLLSDGSRAALGTGLGHSAAATAVALDNRVLPAVWLCLALGAELSSGSLLTAVGQVRRIA